MSDLKRYLDPTNCMTVGQLKELLDGYDDELPVVFGHTANDYWNTSVADSLSDGEEGHVTWSTYHSKARQVDPDKEGEDDDPIDDMVADGRAFKVLILS